MSYDMATDSLSRIHTQRPYPDPMEISAYIPFTLDTPKRFETAIQVLRFKQVHSYDL